MKQLLIRSGGVTITDVPAPAVGRKNVLVRVCFSCVSVGTEIASVQTSGMPLYRRALKQPENVKRVLQMARDQGVRQTYNRVTGKLSAGTPTGYSAAGVVTAVGESVEGFSIGDRVACAGAGIANHAQYIDVPVNLCVKVPQALGLDTASTVTLGAIALQGVRRCAPTLGETIVVVGLGVLGQITAQILRANGCRVIGVDVDSMRLKVAIDNGMDHAIDPAIEDYPARIAYLTEGFGADAAIITAASESSKIVSEAMQACRKKGRVVLVGDVGLNLNRADFYAKELDFLVSTSYGPGRYDATYEEQGQDYPLPYVRWTENRNMEMYLSLLRDGRLSTGNLPTKVFTIDAADQAYQTLGTDGPKPLVVLLSYPDNPAPASASVLTCAPRMKPTGKISVAIAGAGGFAQGMHLPNLLRQRKDFALRWVLSRTGSNAKAIAAQYEAVYATTDFRDVLSDPDVDLILIATRHNLHASMVLDALSAGKHVFVEKPLALLPQDVNTIEAFYAEHPNGPVLMTGFNRRFSPAIAQVKQLLHKRETPLIVNYRMNAGYIAKDHWVHGEEGGGRNLGEACHIYDLFGCLTEARVAKVQALSINAASKQWLKNDNFVATISYHDGSVCSLTYTALGCKSHPKEKMDIYFDGKVLSMDDYRAVSIQGCRRKPWTTNALEKGQMEELQALADCLLRGMPWPIPLSEQLETTRVGFEIERQVYDRADDAATL